MTVLKLAFRIVDVVSDGVVKFFPIHLQIFCIDFAGVGIYKTLV